MHEDRERHKLGLPLPNLDNVEETSRKRSRATRKRQKVFKESESGAVQKKKEEVKSPLAAYLSEFTTEEEHSEKEVKSPLAAYLSEFTTEEEHSEKASLSASPSPIMSNSTDACFEEDCETEDIFKHSVSIILKHFSGESFKCSKCNEQFQNMKVLLKHMQLHVQEFQCQFCHIHVSSRSLFVRHLRTHKEYYVCPICIMCFSRQSSLITHMRIHTEYTSHKCVICNKLFLRKEVLLVHMSSHENSICKPYSTVFQCQICDKPFTGNCALIEHLKCHALDKFTICRELIPTGQKIVYQMQNDPSRLYTCPVCKKNIINKNALVDHMKMHSKVEAHECVVCKTRFFKKVQLHVHMQIHSKNMKDKKNT